MGESNFSREIGTLVSEVGQLKESINQINNKLDSVIVEGSFKAHLRDNLEEMERDGYYDNLYARCKAKHDTEAMSRANSFMNLIRNISSIVIVLSPIAYIIIQSIK